MHLFHLSVFFLKSLFYIHVPVLYNCKKIRSKRYSLYHQGKNCKHYALPDEPLSLKSRIFLFKNMLHQCKLHAACVPSVCIKKLPYLNVFLKSLYFLAHGIGCLMFKTNGYVGVAEVFLKHSWYFFCIVKLILSLFLAKELYFSV